MPSGWDFRMEGCPDPEPKATWESPKKGFVWGSTKRNRAKKGGVSSNSGGGGWGVGGRAASMNQSKFHVKIYKSSQARK